MRSNSYDTAASGETAPRLRPGKQAANATLGPAADCPKLPARPVLFATRSQPQPVSESAYLTLLANKADVLRAHADLQARVERVQKWLQIGFGMFAGLLAALVIAALRYLPAIGHGAKARSMI